MHSAASLRRNYGGHISALMSFHFTCFCAECICKGCVHIPETCSEAPGKFDGLSALSGIDLTRYEESDIEMERSNAPVGKQ